ncbi:hypothetical protein TK43_12725 [Roseovarius sp. JS7-11]|jgi:hypothetical protein|nr:hypothetical protein TK43_12725 [Roseovarius sp. JS7-11]
MAWPLAGMKMRGSEALRIIELIGTCTDAALSNSDPTDLLHILFGGHLPLPMRRDGMASAEHWAIAATGVR